MHIVPIIITFDRLAAGTVYAFKVATKKKMSVHVSIKWGGKQYFSTICKYFVKKV